MQAVMIQLRASVRCTISIIKLKFPEQILTHDPWDGVDANHPVRVGPDKNECLGFTGEKMTTSHHSSLWRSSEIRLESLQR